MEFVPCDRLILWFRWHVCSVVLLESTQGRRCVAPALNDKAESCMGVRAVSVLYDLCRLWSDFLPSHILPGY